jgi:putative intracellular protease/amidase
MQILFCAWEMIDGEEGFDDIVPVVVDGEMITGQGPEAAREFGQKIAESLFSQS